MTRTTALHDWHVEHDARMVPFAGYSMPVFYPTGAIQEHHLVRQSAGLFDIDHMGQVEVRGDQAEAYLKRLLTWDVSQMATREAHYALMCAEDGGVIDDIFVYRLPDRWLVVINAANRLKDVVWMQQVAGDFAVRVDDVSDATYMIALQGPQAIELLQHVTDADVADMARFPRCEAKSRVLTRWSGARAIRARMGSSSFLRTRRPSRCGKRCWRRVSSTASKSRRLGWPPATACASSLGSRSMATKSTPRRRRWRQN